MRVATVCRSRVLFFFPSRGSLKGSCKGFLEGLPLSGSVKGFLKGFFNDFSRFPKGSFKGSTHQMQYLRVQILRKACSSQKHQHKGIASLYVEDVRLL